MDFKKQHLELLADIAELDQGLVDREANLLHDLGLDSPPSEMPPNLSFVFADQTARDIERTEQDIAAESAPSPHFIQDSSSRRNDSSRQSSPSQSSNWRRAPAESAGLSAAKILFYNRLKTGTASQVTLAAQLISARVPVLQGKSCLKDSCMRH
jgi:hypothetical protein